MSDSTIEGSQPAEHWDAVYLGWDIDALSWYQPTATVALDRIRELGLALDAPIIDVGAGTSPLVDGLLDRGHRDITALDISTAALGLTRERLGERARDVHWITADLLDWVPARRYRFWHDRAVFHFLTDPADRNRYRALLRAGVEDGGFVLIVTFAADGPERCSGLPTARYTPDELGAAAGPEFSVAHTGRELHRTPAGGDQPFTWVLLRRLPDTT